MAHRILVVDDEALIRLLYERELVSIGYEVTTAESGTVAIEMATEDQFDLAVLDIEMPGLDGLATLNRLREAAPQMAVILNTAYAIYKADFQTWLADAYVVKSSDLQTLVDQIRKVLENR
ncbi:MAG: response regulator [candidate division Zixibacteria bacterium]|nr:response regulator [candidate division Zixibacteria bacterium]